MIKIWVVAVLLTLTSAAYATGNHKQPQQKQGQTQGQLQGQGQAQKANSRAKSSANARASAFGLNKNRNTSVARGGNSRSTASQKSYTGGNTQDSSYEGTFSDSSYTGMTVEGDTSSLRIDGDTTLVEGDPAEAQAGLAASMIAGCRQILGFDFRGSNGNSNGGASFGVPLNDEICRAILLDRMEMAQDMQCTSRRVWGKVRDIHRARTGERLTKWEAIDQCLGPREVEVREITTYVAQCDEERPNGRRTCGDREYVAVDKAYMPDEEWKAYVQKIRREGCVESCEK